MIPPKPDRSRGQRVFWLKQLREWHWISSAICLVGLVLFSITGITLNHAGQIEAKPVIATVHATAPASLLAILAAAPAQKDAPLPPALKRWAKDELSVKLDGRTGEWSEDEVYIALPRPGGDAFLTIDRATGEAEYQKTTRGWVSFLNDLHKGRNTGAVWGWFIDIFAVACLAFAITGLLLLYLLSKTRKLTWPLVAAGLAIPALLAILFLHL
jgi:hypothetical protein